VQRDRADRAAVADVAAVHQPCDRRMERVRATAAGRAAPGFAA
jgi:hypothetical protein